MMRKKSNERKITWVVMCIERKIRKRRKLWIPTSDALAHFQSVLAVFQMDFVILEGLARTGGI